MGCTTDRRTNQHCSEIPGDSNGLEIEDSLTDVFSSNSTPFLKEKKKLLLYVSMSRMGAGTRALAHMWRTGNKLKKKFDVFILMCISGLPAYMPVHYMHAWRSWRSEEGTGVIDCCKLLGITQVL